MRLPVRWVDEIRVGTRFSITTTHGKKKPAPGGTPTRKESPVEGERGNSGIGIDPVIDAGR